jgi:hypothetical protein
MDDCTPIAGHFDSHGSCAKQNALPNAACPGLHTKATGRCRWATAQGNIKQNNDDKCTNFAIRFDGRGGMPVVHGFPLNAAIGQALAPITSIRHANVGCLLYISLSNRQRIPQLPLITIGV